MLQPTLSALLGVAFVVVGGATVWSMFHAAARLRERGASSRLVTGHRIGGYVFVALFAVMTYYMILRVADVPGELGARPMTHLVIAVVMMPLLFSKILIARYYKTAYYSALMPLGLTIFSLGFVLVTVTVGPYLLRRASVEDISLASVDMGEKTIDVNAAQVLTQQRCATCHTLDRAIGARKDQVGWLNTVNRMRAYPGSNISSEDARTILAYLVSQVGLDASTPQGEQSAGKALVDAKCAKCHDLDRVYRTVKTPDEWKASVIRMEVYAGDGYFKPGERDEVVKFLAETQTPEAAERRAAAIAKAEPSAPTPIAESTETSRSGLSSYLVVGVAVIAFGGLLARRPRRRAASTAPSGGAPDVGPATPPPPHSAPGRTTTHLLTLARVVEQTHDAKTLRFLVPGDRPFSFKPGQFLTFDWVVDGARVVRSYSICSSSAQSRYVEVTVKRVADGRVSIFANDRAAVGLTVEAKGPSGRFAFDEAAHDRVVLVAAGSGITPMMSILRTIDDLSLPTDVTLIYAVRTPRDVIFERDLRALERRLAGFRLLVVASRPDETWTGPTGRISRDLVEANVKDPAAAHFFLCGPKPFMDAAREILAGLGVPDDRVLRESFGGPPATPAGAGLAAVEGHVRFAASGVECDVPEGRTLLEVAEMNGVPIPSSCRQGQCGTCVTRLVDGDVAMDAEDGLDPDAKSRGYVLTCVGRARGDVTLDA